MNDIADKLQSHSTHAQNDWLAVVHEMSVQTQTIVYLVGGALRNAILCEPIGDLDFIVEGDAILFAEKLGQHLKAPITKHDNFRTATVFWQDLAIDFATARTERYVRPAALPIISPSTIEQDLKRRDFTINTLAYSLQTSAFVDMFGGLSDLQKGVIRALHSQSFVDDPTRILRAARYASHYNFVIEPETLIWLEAGLPYLRDLSGERIKYDIELIFTNTKPADALSLLKSWGFFKVLGIPTPSEELIHNRYNSIHDYLHNAQMGKVSWNLSELRLTREELLQLLGWGVITYNQGQLSTSRWIERIPFTIQTRDCLNQIGPLSTLSRANFAGSNSQKSDLLKIFGGNALFLGWLFDNDVRKRQAMYDEWHSWRWVKPHLNGDELRKMGLNPSPIFTTILKFLRSANINNPALTIEEERLLVQEILEKESKN